MLNIRCDHAICLPKIVAHLDCLWQNMNKQHGAKNYQCLLNRCKVYFLQCFSCVLRKKNIFSVWERERKSSFVCKNLQEDISCFCSRHQMFSPFIILSQSLTIGEKIQHVLQKQEILNVYTQNRTYFFFENTEDVLLED